MIGESAGLMERPRTLPYLDRDATVHHPGIRQSPRKRQF